MKFRVAIPSVTLAIAGVLPLIAPTAGAVDTTQVTIVDGYQYDAQNLMSLTVCLDDTLVQQGDAVINPAVTSTPGSHTLSITQDEAACGDDVDWITADVTLLDVESQAVVIGWPTYNQDQTRTLPVTVFADDLSCTPSDQGRLWFRNVNSADADVNFGETTGGDPTALFENVAVDEEASALVASPAYPTTGEAIGWVEGDGIWELWAPVTSYATSPGTVNVIYAYGGNDGDIGLVNHVLPASVCATPETTTTTVVTPPAIAPAAVAVTTQPTYTG